MNFSTITPLEGHTLPPFPVEVLPPVFQRFASELAESYQVPVDLPASMMLGVLAAVIAKHYSIAGGPDWIEPCNLFVGVAQPPASRKSAIVKEVVRPLEEIERERLADFKKTAADDDNKPAPRLLADDISPERLATMLALHDGKMAVISAEGGIFETMGGRYSSVPNFDVFLKGHAGDTLRVDRVNRAPDLIEQPALTLALTFQPDVLKGLADKPGFRGRGLLGRFLYSVPHSLVGSRKIDSIPVNVSSRTQYINAVKTLFETGSRLFVESGYQERLLVLSQEAADVLRDYRMSNERDLGPSGKLEFVQDWGGKLIGHILRIAASLHLMEHYQSPDMLEVSSETVYSAIRIGEYFKAHAIYAFDVMGASGNSVDAARRVLSWLRRESRQTFTLREAHQRHKGSYSKDVIEEAVEVLIEHGYVMPELVPEHSGPGRKPSPSFMANPEIYSQYSQNIRLA